VEAAQSSRRSIGEILVESGRLSQADLQEALAEEASTDRRLADILVDRGLVDGQDVTDALMVQFESAGLALAPVPDAQLESPAEPESVGEAAVVPFPSEPSLTPVDDQDPAVTEPPLVPDGDDHDPTETPAATWTDMTASDELPPPAADLVLADTTAAALLAELAARRRVADQELAAERDAHADLLRGLDELRAQLEARDLSTDRLAQELQEAEARLRGRDEELSAQAAIWEEAYREAEHAATQMAELRERLEAKNQELSESRATAEHWAGRVAALEAEADALAAGVASASQTVHTFLDAGETPATPPPAGQHDVEPDQDADVQPVVLCFVPDEEGHELVEYDGAVPSVGETLDLATGRFVVTKVGRSPLPHDERSCVFLTPSS